MTRKGGSIREALSKIVSFTR